MNIIDPNRMLDDEQLNTLQIAGRSLFDHPIGGFSSVDEILDTSGVTVAIKPGIEEKPISEDFFWAELDWRHIKGSEQKTEMDGNESSKCENCKGNQRKYHELKTLKVSGHCSADSKTITLYPDKMASEYSGKRMNEQLVSTLFHEAMHIYFTRPGHEHFHKNISLEEPLAEFGMLLCIHNSTTPGINQYYEWAYNEVKSKSYFYRYGAKLMEQFLNEGDPYSSDIYHYLEEYMFNVCSLELPDVSNGKIKLPSQMPEVGNMTMFNQKYFQLCLHKNKSKVSMSTICSK